MSQLDEARVVIAVPLAGPMVYWRTVAAILEMEKPAETDLMVFQGALIDRARNHLVERMLDHPIDPTHLLFLDSDIVPAADTLLRLLTHRQPIVSGLYRKRTPPHEVMAFVTSPPTPLLNKERVAGGRVRWRPISPRGSGLRPVDYVGAGCLLIERRVFEKVKRPWFQVINTARRHLPEDFFFCEQARRAGFKIWLDPSVRPLHLEPMGVGTDRSGKVAIIPLD